MPLEVLQGIEASALRNVDEAVISRLTETLRNLPRPSVSRFAPRFGSKPKDQPTPPAPRIKTGARRGPKPKLIDWDAQPLGQVSDAELAKRLGVGIQKVERERRAKKLKRYDPENSLRRLEIDWDVIAPYLGKVPDDELAGKIGTTRQRVGEERKSRRIPPWPRGSKKKSLDDLPDGAWYLDETNEGTLWDRVSEVTNSLEVATVIRPIELLQRCKMSASNSNLEDAMEMLRTLGWKEQPNGQWKRLGLRGHVRSTTERESDAKIVLAYLKGAGGMRSSTEVAAACNMTTSQARTTLGHLHAMKQIKAFGQARARRYILI